MLKQKNAIGIVIFGKEKHMFYRILLMLSKWVIDGMDFQQILQ